MSPASDPTGWLTTPDSDDSAAAASNTDLEGLGTRAVIPDRPMPASTTGDRPIATTANGDTPPTTSGSRPLLAGSGPWQSRASSGSDSRPASAPADSRPTADDDHWAPPAGSGSATKGFASTRTSGTGKTLVANSEERPAPPPEPGTAEPTGPRTADLPATAPAGFDALAADHSRDSTPRPITPYPQAWSETREPARQDYFAPSPGIHQAPASAPGSNYTGSHTTGPNQWGRVVPLRPQSPPEPPGALVFEDVIYPLDRAYVVGRNPSGDEAVRAGTAAPLTLPRDRHVSRVHAYVTVEDGVVYVRDAGTSGGTYIAAPGVQEWTRIGDTAVELAPGWRLRLGQKVLTHRPPTRPLAAYPRRY